MTKCVVLGVAAVAVGSVFAVDSVNGTDGVWGSRLWSAKSSWTHDTLPADGIAAFSGNNLNNHNTGNPTLEVDAKPQITGLEFRNFTAPFVGSNPIAFTGDFPYISNNADKTAEVRCVLKGAEAGSTKRLLKRAAGTVRVTKAVENFDALVARDGTLDCTNSFGTVFVNGPALETGTGAIKWTPTAAAGADVAVTAAGALRIGQGQGKLYVTKGNAASASITFTKLEGLNGGGTLVIVPSGGAAALGVTEKIFFTEAPTLRDGILPPTILLHDTAATGKPLRLLTYDSEKGLSVFDTSSVPELVVGAANGLAKLSGTSSLTTTVSSATSVNVLLVENNAQLKFDDGVTLTVGNDGTPSGFIVNSPTSASFSPKGDNGSIDFGSSRGVFFHNNPSGNGTRFSLSGVPIKGSAGVVFAADQGTAGSGYASVSYSLTTCKWTGPTSFCGTRYYPSGDYGQKLAAPEGCDLWLMSRSYSCDDNPVAFLSYRDYTANQHFHFAGNGSWNNGLIHMGANTRMTFNGPVTLEDDVYLTNDNLKEGQVFNGSIDGLGGFNFGNGTWTFTAPNSYAGYTKLSWSTTLTLSKGGTFGKGDVTVGSTNLIFSGVTGVVNVAKITQTTDVPVKMSDSILKFANDCSFNGLTNAGGSNVVEIGTSLKIVTPTTGTADEFRAMTDGATLTLGGAADGTFASKIEDGSNGEKLNVRKVGAGTLTLTGKLKNSGSLDVVQGSLKFAGLLEQAEYWLDASDLSTITTNDNGEVTQWRSKTGTVTFGQEVISGRTFGYPMFTNAWTVGGARMPVLSMFDKTQGQRLVANRKTVQRTVFIVNRPVYLGNTTPSIFGYLNSDCGQRGGSGYWFSDLGAWDFVTEADNLFVNGKVGATTSGTHYEAYYTDGAVQVLTMRHTIDKYNASYNRTSYATFQPSLGGYMNAYDAGDVRSRSFGGEIAEVIAFDWAMSREEMDYVEDYLMAKWTGTPLHGGASEPGLKSDAALSLAAGTAIDLNGRDAEFASLDGIGTVRNTSATPAKLSVKGGAFNGTVEGPLTLSVNGVPKVNATFADAGGKLEVTGGETKVAPKDLSDLPVTDGLSFWIDASWNPETTLVKNDKGQVTNWVCRGGAVKSFKFTANSDHQIRTPPVYDATGFNGKPSVYFDPTNALVTATTAPLHTIFLVSTCKRDQPGNGYCWGAWTADCGYRYGGRSLSVSGGISFTHKDEMVRMNGTDFTGQSTVAMPEYFCLIGRHDAWHGDARYDNGTYAIGRCHNNGGAYENVAEFIGFNRRLTDGEVLLVERYLMEKWIESPAGSFPAKPTTIFKNGGTLEVAGGASVDATGYAVSVSTLASGGGELKADSLSVTDAFVFEVTDGKVGKIVVDGDLTIGSQAVARFLNGDTLDRAFPMQKALEVTGSVTGNLTEVEGLSRKWSWSRAGNVWSVVKNGLMLLLR